MSPGRQDLGIFRVIPQFHELELDIAPEVLEHLGEQVVPALYINAANIIQCLDIKYFSTRCWRGTLDPRKLYLTHRVEVLGQHAVQVDG